VEGARCALTRGGTAGVNDSVDDSAERQCERQCRPFAGATVVNAGLASGEAIDALSEEALDGAQYQRQGAVAGIGDARLCGALA
jgi:hypothetical protein